jgi:hypothetical protein
MSTHPDITALAAACAARLATAAAEPITFERDFQSLLDAVRRSDPKFAFEREGRPAAVAAVREALPSSEQELLDAILEDHTCELAAVYEAMLQVACVGMLPGPAEQP